MPTFNNMAELEAYLNSEIRKAMETDVADVAKKTMQEKVITDVYNQYDSNAKNKYQRTGDLYQDKNIQTEMINDNTLSIENVTKDPETGRLIAPVVEEGTGYEWKYSEIYKRQPFPRPFVEETARDLENGLATEALKQGLKGQGIDVE